MFVLLQTLLNFKGQKIMMTGTAELVTAPQQNTVFLEDLPPEQQAVAAYPPGLVNVGNTCYMNASLQFLFAVPEFKDALDKFVPKDGDQNTEITKEARVIWKRLAEGKSAITPDDFLRVFRRAYTQFAEEVVCS